MNFAPAARPPLSSNVKVEPQPLGMYLSMRSWYGLDLSTGQFTFSTSGWDSRNSATANVFDACLKYEDDTIKFDFDNPGEDDGTFQEQRDTKVDFLDADSMLIDLPELPEKEKKVDEGDFAE